MDILRQRLDSLEGKPHAAHAGLLAKISEDIPNDITLVELADFSRPFNCHMFSTGIQDSREVIRLLEAGPNNLTIGSGFINLLIQKQVLIESPDGQLIVYYSKDTPKHSGQLLDDGRVMSKWGRDHLYIHGLWQVPTGYGDNYKKFVTPDTSAVISTFQEYAAPFMKELA